MLATMCVISKACIYYVSIFLYVYYNIYDLAHYESSIQEYPITEMFPLIIQQYHDPCGDL